MRGLIGLRNRWFQTRCAQNIQPYNLILRFQMQQMFRCTIWFVDSIVEFKLKLPIKLSQMTMVFGPQMQQILKHKICLVNVTVEFEPE